MVAASVLETFEAVGIEKTVRIIEQTDDAPCAAPNRLFYDVFSFMAQPDINIMPGHYGEILKEIGGDLNAEGVKETPLRAAKFWWR